MGIKHQHSHHVWVPPCKTNGWDLPLSVVVSGHWGVTLLSLLWFLRHCMIQWHQICFSSPGCKLMGFQHIMVKKSSLYVCIFSLYAYNIYMHTCIIYIYIYILYIYIYIVYIYIYKYIVKWDDHSILGKWGRENYKDQNWTFSRCMTWVAIRNHGFLLIWVCLKIVYP